MVSLWICFRRLYSDRVAVLAGTIKIDDQPLPAFHLKASMASAPSWSLEQDCTNGFYVIYGVPPGKITAEFTWGSSGSCEMATEVEIQKKTTLLDLDVDLGIEDFDVVAGSRDTSALKTAQITWKFKEPKRTPESPGLTVKKIRFLYTVSHVDIREYPAKAGTWDGPNASPPEWTVTTDTDAYTHSGGTEKWLVVVQMDGAPDIKKAARASK